MYPLLNHTKEEVYKPLPSDDMRGRMDKLLGEEAAAAHIGRQAHAIAASHEHKYAMTKECNYDRWLSHSPLTWTR